MVESQHQKSFATVTGALSLSALSLFNDARAAEPVIAPTTAHKPVAATADHPTMPRPALIKRGEKIPEIFAERADGTEVKINDIAPGKLVLLQLWGPWCGACRAELNEPGTHAVPRALEDIVVKDPESGKVIAKDFVTIAVSVNLSSGDAASGQSYARGNPLLSRALNLHIAGDKAGAMEAKLQYTGYPAWFLLDGEKRVIFSTPIKEPMFSQNLGKMVDITHSIKEIPELLKRDGFLRGAK